MKTKIERVSLTLYFGKYVWQDSEDCTVATIYDRSDDPEFIIFESRKCGFDVEVPDGTDLTQARVDAMKKQRQKVLADAQIECEKIDKQIASLMAITAE